MTATDELRRLLDERGVEWKGGETDLSQQTMWSTKRNWCVFAKWRDDVDVADALTVYHVTPEQAIAATLGDEDTYTREDVEGAFVRGYSLGCLPVGSDPQWDENRQTVDEHMAELGWVRKEDATLGRGEYYDEDGVLHIRCHRLPERIEVTLPDERGREVYSARVHAFERREECHIAEYDDTGIPVCSECGAVQPDDFTVYYCWSCGRRVVAS